jgi:hypothetical protein
VEQTSRHPGGDRILATAPGRSRTEVATSCAVVAFAFLPVLIDLARHLAQTPWARYAALFPALAVVCARQERDPLRPARRDAAAFLVAGLLVLLLAHFMGSVRWGRAGAAFAAIGLCRRFGWGTGRSQALWLFAVPLPAAALRLAEPLARQMLALADACVAPLGIDAAPVAIGRSGSGLALVPLMAGLGWYTALRCRLPLPAALARAALGALLALPTQFAATLLAALSAPAIGAEAARSALIHVPWMLVAAAGVGFAERAARR